MFARLVVAPEPILPTEENKEAVTSLGTDPTNCVIPELNCRIEKATNQSRKPG